MTVEPDNQARILVVDDDPALRKGIARLIAGAGYAVLEAGTGKDALEIAAMRSPDLVLLDVELPDIRGWEVCRKIRMNSNLKGMCIVMLSSHLTSSDDQVIGLEFGADGYIVRPIPNRELLARIHAFIRLKKAEEALRRSDALLLEAQKERTLGIIAGGIAHGYNNLLAVILGNLEMAIEDQPADSPGLIFLKDAWDATLSATDLTRKFLTISDGAAPRKKIADFTALIRDLLIRFESIPGVTLRSDLPSHLPPMACDIDMMSQAIDALLRNAIEAMPKGGELRVSLSIARIANDHKHAVDLKSGDYAELLIIDTGIGIPPSDQPRIFDPYFSTKERGTQKGMGLGLPVARSIITQHGGAIYVDTVANQGTRVTVYLPFNAITA